MVSKILALFHAIKKKIFFSFSCFFSLSLSSFLSFSLSWQKSRALASVYKKKKIPSQETEDEGQLVATKFQAWLSTQPNASQ